MKKVDEMSMHVWLIMIAQLIHDQHDRIYSFPAAGVTGGKWQMIRQGFKDKQL